MRAHGRDVPEDGLQAAQSITATALGFERDVACVWGDDFERSEADFRRGQDDGNVHDHWMCDDDNVVLRRVDSNVSTASEEFVARAIGPGTELFVVLVLWVVGAHGLFFGSVRD